MMVSLPPDDVIVARAQRGDWCGALGIRPGTTLSGKERRHLRALVHPDKGRRQDVAAAVGESLDALSRPRTLDALLAECARAAQTEPLNEEGGEALRERLRRLEQAFGSGGLVSVARSGWAKQVRARCRSEAHSVWQVHKQRISAEPHQATCILELFLAKVRQIAAFQETLDPEEARCLILDAKAWTHNEVVEAAAQAARASPEAIRRRRAEAQRERRSAQAVSVENALAKVMEHCELVSEGRLATPLPQLKARLRAAGIDGKTLLAAGISAKTRRQHRPKEGEHFCYATVVVDDSGKHSPIRLKKDAPEEIAGAVDALLVDRRGRPAKT